MKDNPMPHDTTKTSQRLHKTGRKLVMLGDNANVKKFQETFLHMLPPDAQATITSDWDIGKVKGFAGMFWSWSFSAFGW